jgi:hypothetical protein
MDSTRLNRVSGFLFPSEHGPRNDTSIKTVLTALASYTPDAPGTIVLDAGTWDIATDTVIPATVTLIMLQGSKFVIASGANLSLLCNFVAGVELKFDGAGTASGPALFPYRIPEWSAVALDPDFNIGTGYLEADLSADYIATQDDTDTGTNDTKFVTPLKLKTTEFNADQLPAHDQLSGVAVDQHRRITVSSGPPAGGVDGDIWFQYA